MPEDRDLDLLIDSALKSYAYPHANESLAQRVLTRLANEPAPQRRVAWVPWIAVAVPAAICLVWLVSSEFTKPHVAPTIQSSQLHNPAAVSGLPDVNAPRLFAEARQSNRSAPDRHLTVAASVTQPLPKLDVFPTPAPLTTQERALAAYAAQAPQAQQKALAQSEQEPTPLTVASFHVMPLKTLDIDALNDANTNF